MLEPKTHYEQVSLEIVRKIVEEQIRQEITAEQYQAIRTIKWKKDPSEEQEELMAGSGSFSKLER